MTAVTVTMFSPLGPDLANATGAEVIAAIMKAFGHRPFVWGPTVNPQAVTIAEVNAWLVGHGCRRFAFRDYIHDSFELVEVGS